jgi:hypothetical protein
LVSESNSNISTTSGFQYVKVPVLSKITTSISFVFSKASAFLIKIQFFAPVHVPTIIAAGVASQRAQGHAITRVETDATSAEEISQLIRYHTINVTIEINIITGTKICDILSTIF